MKMGIRTLTEYSPKAGIEHQHPFFLYSTLLFTLQAQV